MLFRSATSDSAYWHFPAQEDTPQGVHTATYTEPGADESARYRDLCALVQALDTRARQWYTYAINARDSHWRTMRALERCVHRGLVDPQVLEPIPLVLPVNLDSPIVGGAWPPRGPVRVPRGSIHLPPYVSQPQSVCTFTGRAVRLPHDLGYY